MERTGLVGQAHQSGLTASGRDGDQREHVAGDDVALTFGQVVKVLFRAGERGEWVREPMQAMRWVGVVPVVEEVVVKERAADERSAIDADSHALESLGHGEACARDGDHVRVHAHGSVLDDVPREAEPALRFQGLGDAGDFVDVVDLVDGAGCATHGAGFRTVLS